MTSLIQKCKAENVSAAEEKAAADKRRQYVDELRATRAQNASNMPEGHAREDMDTLLDKLRAGDSVGKKNRRNRGAAGRQSISIAPRIAPQVTGGSGEAADIAKDMLAALKKDGLTSPSATPNVPSSQVTKPRRSRLRGSLRGEKGEDAGSSVDLINPQTEASIPEDTEDEVSTVKLPTPRLDSPFSARGGLPSPVLVVQSSGGESTIETKELPQLPPR